MILGFDLVKDKRHDFKLHAIMLRWHFILKLKGIGSKFMCIYPVHGQNVSFPINNYHNECAIMSIHLQL